MSLLDIQRKYLEQLKNARSSAPSQEEVNKASEMERLGNLLNQLHQAGAMMANVGGEAPKAGSGFDMFGKLDKKNLEQKQAQAAMQEQQALQDRNIGLQDIEAAQSAEKFKNYQMQAPLELQGMKQKLASGALNQQIQKQQLQPSNLAEISRIQQLNQTRQQALASGDTLAVSKLDDELQKFKDKQNIQKGLDFYRAQESTPSTRSAISVLERKLKEFPSVTIGEQAEAAKLERIQQPSNVAVQKPTAEQLRIGLMADIGQRGLQGMKSMIDKGFDPGSTANAIGVIGKNYNIPIGDEYKKFDSFSAQAREGIIRTLTGAGMTISEATAMANDWAPRIGNSKELVAQKIQFIEDTINAMQHQAGAGAVPSEISQKQPTISPNLKKALDSFSLEDGISARQRRLNNVPR